MEGKGPYRIYDPGGSEPKDEASSVTYRQLLEENCMLRERMKGLKSLGDLLEESQTEASKLRQRVEELVRDNEILRSSSSFNSAVGIALPTHAETQVQDESYGENAGLKETQECQPRSRQRPASSEGSSEFEVVNLEERRGSDEENKSGAMLQLPQENAELVSQLQKLESSLSVFAEESNKNQLLTHLGRMALEFNRLSSKVQKNEQKTSLLQTLCEQLRQENTDLRRKMEEDLQYRNQDLEELRQENLKLKKLVTGSDEQKVGLQFGSKQDVLKQEPVGVKMEVALVQQGGKAVEKSESKSCDPEVYEKKIKLLEKQRKDVLEINKQWDIQWNSMRQQFEQKITDLRQRLADSQKAVSELEAEREQKLRDYDRKLLLAKSKIENLQAEKERLTAEVTDLKHKMKYVQDQLTPLTKQREYQEKEIQRLNRALEEALNLQPASAPQAPVFSNHGDGAMNFRRQELLTQITVLKEQVKIFEEDFQKERSDRERMNEEKEELKQQVERLQDQMIKLTGMSQLRQAQSDCQRERVERYKLEKLQRHLKQGHERRTSDPTTGSVNPPVSPPYCGPFVQPGHQAFEGWGIHFPPRAVPVEHGRDFQPFQAGGFVWPPFHPPRSPRGPGESTRPPPENTEPMSPGLGKSERQNIDPGKH
uniref:TNFAIP3-interacting protein 1 n=1 Tax=Lepisosteus oculatus TaxID=7918 RepID=W5N1J1_LEPOC